MWQKNSYKNRILFTAGCLLLITALTGCGSSFNFVRSMSTNGTIIPVSGNIIAKHEFRVGEKLTYEIKWLGVPVGLAYFHVKKIIQIDGRDCYHISVLVKSNVFLSKIYRVNDEFHTYIDKEKLYSRRFIKKQQEGRYRSHEIVDYDHQRKVAVYKSLLNGSVKEFSIRENTQDDLSAIYRFRIMDIDLGKKVLMDVNADEKDWVLEIRFLQKGFVKLRRIGRIAAIEVEPVATRTDGKKLQKGRVWIWFGADENRIPLAAQAKAPIVGTVTAILTDVK